MKNTSSTLITCMATRSYRLSCWCMSDMLKLMQEIVVDRKKLFIVTSGDPEQQLNKLKQSRVAWPGKIPDLLFC
jgi:hypothetical protein